MRVWKAVENFMNVDGRLATTLEVEAALQAGEAAKEEIARLKAEMARHDCALNVKADADSRVQAVIDAVVSWNGGVFPHVLDQYRPKPKYVWEEGVDNYGNEVHRLKLDVHHSVWQILLGGKIVWRNSCTNCAMTYPTADLAKAAVEKMLTEGGK